jgi:hypothetical protein
MVEQLFTATGEDKDTGRDQEEKVRPAKREPDPKTLEGDLLSHSRPPLANLGIRFLTSKANREPRRAGGCPLRQRRLER